MSLRTRVALSVSLIAVGAVAEASSTAWQLELDPAVTEIRFTLGATLHSVRGTVAIEAGAIGVDSASGDLSGEVVADARSAVTGHEGRDREMHRKVLESERFPRFVFAPKRFVGTLNPTGESRIEVHGDLTVYGATHPVVLPTEVRIDARELSARATLTVPYVEWGMRNPSKLALRVKKFVEVEIELLGTLRTSPPDDADRAEPPN